MTGKNKSPVVPHDADSINNVSVKKSASDKKFWQYRVTAEEERLNRWNEKNATENVPVKFEINLNQKTGNTELRVAKIEKKHTSVDDVLDLQASVICAAFGTAGEEYTLRQMNQAINAQFVNEKSGAAVANATIEALIAMKPNDIVEGQLCARLVTLTDQVNEYMRRAAIHDQPLGARETYINLATKLMRVYNETLESLNKYRRKGEQRVVVQHVTVNDGGRAVVANEFTQQGVGVQGKVKE